MGVGIVRNIGGDGVTGYIEIEDTGGRIDFIDVGLSVKGISQGKHILFVNVTTPGNIDVAIELILNLDHK